eukprot:g2597.t1
MATTASDSQVIMRQPQLIDIVDEAWAQDSLSDDEIVVTNELDNGNEDSDIDSPGDPTEFKKKQEETWTDLDLDRIARTSIN